MVNDMVGEMRRYYEERMADKRERQAQAPAEVAELDQRLTRLRSRLKAGDPDMAAEYIMAVIEKVEAQRAAALAAMPHAKLQEKVLRALPAAAKQYRDQITKGFGKNLIEAGRAGVGHSAAGGRETIR